MNTQPTFEIDTSKEFPRLRNAPIVEAVIHWRARGEKAVHLEGQLEQLKAKLPSYPKVNSQQEIQVESKFGPESVGHTQTAHWHGFRFETADGRYIAQFTRNGFVFSRVRPYENWDRFAGEANRLWRVYAEFTEPSEIERLGVRFINRIAPVDLNRLDEVLTLPPKSPASLALPIDGFLHRSLFNVQGHPYSVSVIQTIQPPTPPESDSIGLILDIDVFTTTTVEMNKETLGARLSEMRWLKNEVFYSLLTPQMTDRYKES